MSPGAAACSASARMPVFFATHGGGPMPLMQGGGQAHIGKFLRNVPAMMPSKPKAIVVVTAHWEEDVPTIGTHPSPPMYFDYHGFPPETYKYSYPAPGPSAELRGRIKALLTDGGFPSLQENPQRGFDHGTFVPLLLMYPEADIPVVQMSCMSSMDPAAHFKLGAALAPLRDEGVLVMGSGSTFHNMRAFMQSFGGKPEPQYAKAAHDFDNWLVDACTKHTGAERGAMLDAWASAPGGRASHPREEHLIPLMVMAGAAGQDQGQALNRQENEALPLSNFMFK